MYCAATIAKLLSLTFTEAVHTVCMTCVLFVAGSCVMATYGEVRRKLS